MVQIHIRRRRGILAALVLLTIVPSAAQATEEGRSSVIAAEPASELRPVPVPAPSPEAIRYHRSGNWLWLVDQVWAFTVPAVLLVTGTSARLRNAAHKIGRVWYFTVGIYCLLFSLVIFITDLPLAYYQGFIRQHAYGLSNQSLARWAGNMLKGLGVELIVGFLFLWVPYFLIARSTVQNISKMTNDDSKMVRVTWPST